jgi:hypothetical protein
MQNSFGISSDGVVQAAREYNKKVGFSGLSRMNSSSDSSNNSIQ